MNEQTRLLVRAEYGGRCAYCGKKLTDETFHVDHILPRCLGGSDAFGNLIASCSDCNYAKRGMHPHEWVEKLGGFENIFCFTKKGEDAAQKLSDFITWYFFQTAGEL